MAKFEKGQSGNPKGKRKGKKNKTSAYFNTFCSYIIDGGGEKFKTEFNKLEGKEYVSVFIKLSKFVTDEQNTIVANEYILSTLKGKTK